MSSFLPTNPALSGPPANHKYQGRRLRFVGTPDRPEWVALDVCDIMEIDNVSQALADFDDDEKGIKYVYTAAGKQKLLTVYEPGLYRLMVKSRTAEAKQFRSWIFKEVLPSIRKYGFYPPPENAGYAISLKPYTSRVVWVMQVRRVLQPGYWCVFIEGAEILIGAEYIFGPANLEMKQYDLLDGSIGSHWAGYRDDKPWRGKRIPYDYTFPEGDPRGTVKPWSYPMQELEHFKHWLHSEYWTIKMPEYIKRKYGAKQYQLALPIFAGLGVPMLK
jgi:prophage antirepressor-like protein